MPPMSRRTKAYLLAAALAFLLANPLSWILRREIRGASGMIFGILALIWTETLRTRLSGKTLRRCMLSGAFLLFTLFPLRECRYSIFPVRTDLDRVMWYAFYIPILTVPLLFFCAALSVDRREEDHPLRYAHILSAVPAVLSVLFLTNNRHFLAFRFLSGQGDAAVRGPVYWAGAVWVIVINLCAFGVLMHRCRLSASRRLWYVPFLSALPAVGLSIWYGLSGGSPKLGDLPLFQYQEAYGLLYVCVWEACIQIGLLPTSADYDKLFTLSSVNAVIADMDGQMVYSAENAPSLTEPLIRAAAEQPVPVGENRWLRWRPIPGGSVLWCEDLSEMLRLNGELERANEALAMRNAVLEAENEIRQTRARLEAANRLWDGIVKTIRPQLRVIGGKLENREPSEEDLADVAFLGAYIKRRSNLALLAEGEDTLSTEELGLAVRESLAYLSLRGLLCDVREDGEERLSAAAVTAAYDAFEDAAEAALRGEGAEEPGSLLVTLTAGEGAFSMTLLFDCPAPALSSSVRQICAEAGFEEERWEEDGAGYLRLRIRRGGSAEDVDGERRESHG